MKSYKEIWRFLKFATLLVVFVITVIVFRALLNTNQYVSPPDDLSASVALSKGVVQYEPTAVYSNSTASQNRNLVTAVSILNTPSGEAGQFSSALVSQNEVSDNQQNQPIYTDSYI